MFNKGIKVLAGIVIALNVSAVYWCCKEIHDIRDKTVQLWKKYS